MWVRIAVRYPVWYETEPLARYRMHDNSNTGRHLSSGEDMRYTAMAIALFLEHLPRDLAASVGPKARRTYALPRCRAPGCCSSAAIGSEPRLKSVRRSG